MSAEKRPSSEDAAVATETQLTPQQVETHNKGKEFKQEGDKAFKEGDVKEALKKYHMALLHFKGLTRTNPIDPQMDVKTSKVDEDIAVVYSNMSACHLKLGNYDRTIETADKALALGENNKALYRKAVALGALGYIDKAIAILEDLLKKKLPEHQRVEATLAEMKAKNARLEKESREKLRGFLKKDKELFPSSKKTSEKIPQTSARTAPDGGSTLEPLSSGPQSQSSIVEI